MCELNLVTVQCFTVKLFFFLITVKLCNIFHKIIKITQSIYLFIIFQIQTSTSKVCTLFDKTQNWSKEIFFLFFCPICPCFSFYVCPITSVWNCKFAWTIQ